MIINKNVRLLCQSSRTTSPTQEKYPPRHREMARRFCVRKERARISVWSQRQDETNRDHADETDRKMNPNNPWSRQKENIYIIQLINNIIKT